jgi:hypothetical protein
MGHDFDLVCSGLWRYSTYPLKRSTQHDRADLVTNSRNEIRCLAVDESPINSPVPWPSFLTVRSKIDSWMCIATETVYSAFATAHRYSTIYRVHATGVHSTYATVLIGSIHLQSNGCISKVPDCSLVTCALQVTGSQSLILTWGIHGIHFGVSSESMARWRK